MSIDTVEASLKKLQIHTPDNFNLGYACLNETLRAQKPSVFTSRTCRLATVKDRGMEYVKSLAIQNLHDLQLILEWNVLHDIKLMRMSSEMFPFASHLEYGYSLQFADDLLKQIGDYANLHKLRLTMHPGQYNVLSSPRQDVIANTFRDLGHHAEILNRMGLPSDSVMIIHGGGVYGDKPKALARLAKEISALPSSVRDRLVLENCEMAYTVEDLLPISEKLQIPIVIDFHHDDIHPSSQKVEAYFKRVFAVWQARGIKPKVHVSNSVIGVEENASKTARRKHSDFIRFFHSGLYQVGIDIDVMLECKKKELAIFAIKNNEWCC